MDPWVLRTLGPFITGTGKKFSLHTTCNNTAQYAHLYSHYRAHKMHAINFIYAYKLL